MAGGRRRKPLIDDCLLSNPPSLRCDYLTSVRARGRRSEAVIPSQFSTIARAVTSTASARFGRSGSVDGRRSRSATLHLIREAEDLHALLLARPNEPSWRLRTILSELAHTPGCQGAGEPACHCRRGGGRKPGQSASPRCSGASGRPYTTSRRLVCPASETTRDDARGREHSNLLTGSSRVVGCAWACEGASGSAGGTEFTSRSDVAVVTISGPGTRTTGPQRRCHVCTS